MAYIFLDESGDLGFDPHKHNSKYFVVTVLATHDKRAVEKVVKKVHRRLRKKVKRLSGGVLHCYKEEPSTRKKLLELLDNLDVSIMTIYLDKSRVYTKLQDEKHVLYNYVTNILLDRIMSKKLSPSTGEVVLVAARRETNRFLNVNFASYLKTQAERNHSLSIEILIKTPGEEKSLQAVDFVSWAIFRKHETGDGEYYKIIKHRILEENPLFS